MNNKIFKYESKNSKKIRLKDLLMLFSIFSLCIITIIVTGSVANKNKNTSAKTDALNSAPEELVYEEVSVNKNEPSVQTTTNHEEINMPELKFEKPVAGTVIKPYSPDEVMYSETMDDWRTHMGVDVACPIGSDILSAERGVVTSVKYDINYGNTVVIESDEYTLIYSSLSSDIYVEEGQNVIKGELIAKSSDSCISEICDEPHIHLEMKKDGMHVDPLNYIHFN